MLKHYRRAGKLWWSDRLQGVYSSLEEFRAYDSVYALAERLGYPNCESAWEANPRVSGTTNPADYHEVRQRVPA